MTREHRGLWHRAQLLALSARLEHLRAGLKLESIARDRCSTATVHHALHGSNLKLTSLFDVADGLDCDVEITLKPRRRSA